MIDKITVVILPKKYHPHGWGAPDVEVTTQQTDNLLRFFKKSTTSHAIQQRSCPSSFEVNVQKMARVRIELKFWWKFSQIIIIFWGQFLPPAVYLSALFEVILTWRWSCWVMAPFNKKATSCLHMYVIIKGSNHQCWTLIMSIEKWDSNHFIIRKVLSYQRLDENSENHTRYCAYDDCIVNRNWFVTIFVCWNFFQIIRRP